MGKHNVWQASVPKYSPSIAPTVICYAIEWLEWALDKKWSHEFFSPSTLCHAYHLGRRIYDRYDFYKKAKLFEEVVTNSYLVQEIEYSYGLPVAESAALLGLAGNFLKLISPVSSSGASGLNNNPNGPTVFDNFKTSLNSPEPNAPQPNSFSEFINNFLAKYHFSFCLASFKILTAVLSENIQSYAQYIKIGMWTSSVLNMFTSSEATVKFYYVTDDPLYSAEPFEIINAEEYSLQFFD